MLLVYLSPLQLALFYWHLLLLGNRVSVESRVCICTPAPVDLLIHRSYVGYTYIAGAVCVSAEDATQKKLTLLTP